MIRLVATDLDDTILPEGTFDLNPEYFEVIRELKKKGIIFAAASGRHSSSIRRLFSGLENDMMILAGNGSCVMFRDRVIDEAPLDYGLYLEMVAAMKQIDNSLVLADHDRCVWTDSVKKDMIGWIREGYRVNVKWCEDVARLKPPILKVAMHVGDDAARETAILREMFPGRANIMEAGSSWVDVVANDADKGSAIRRVQEAFGISREETAAFGDNGNDISMLEQAGYSYAVDNARDEVKAAAREVIGPMREDSVLKVLKSLL